MRTCLSKSNLLKSSFFFEKHPKLDVTHVLLLLLIFPVEIMPDLEFFPNQRVTRPDKFFQNGFYFLFIISAAVISAEKAYHSQLLISEITNSIFRPAAIMA